MLFLDQTLKWGLPGLDHPYLHSFLHRSLLVWVFAVVVMVGVSLLTAAPHAGKIEGSVFAVARGPGVGVGEYRVWAGVLFVCTVVLWWWFR